MTSPSKDPPDAATEVTEATHSVAVSPEPEAEQVASALPVLAEGPVVSEARPATGGLSRTSSPALVPAVQAAAAAAGGFLAGAAVIGLVRHRRTARLVRR